MNVWIVNLKDNRKEKTNENNRSKFEICKEKSVIAFGWAVDKSAKTWDEYKYNVSHYSDFSKNDIRSFLKAATAFENMKPDDLVWTRDPNTKKYYICKILSDFEPSVFRNLEGCDISVFRNCEYKEIGFLPTVTNKITWRNLISRPTVRRVLNNTVITETNRLFKEV